MRISHFSNSFIVIQSGVSKIVCDPWVGKANHGGWQSYPEFNDKKLIDSLKNTDYVYISHLHDDHYDPNFLIRSGLIEKTFIIKNFKSKVLIKRLKYIGVCRILELDEYLVKDLVSFKIAIIPQMASNSSEVSDDIQYDLDTSIVISDGTFNFFNQVDNPLSANDYLKIKSYISEAFGEIHIAAFTYGAASEYPQSFLNVNRFSEKRRVIESSLDKLKTRIEILQPKAFFPAGGTYLIPGMLSCLNKFVAIPSEYELVEFAKRTSLNSKLFFLEGGIEIAISNLSPSSWSLKRVILPTTNNFKSAIITHSNDNYEHEDTLVDIKEVELAYKTAAAKWKKKIDLDEIKLSQTIEFIVYDSLSLNGNGEIASMSIAAKFKLFESQTNNYLKIYIDKRAFYNCLTRRQIWNGTLGSLCLFERESNEFDLNVTFSLNYLGASLEEIACFEEIDSLTV